MILGVRYPAPFSPDLETTPESPVSERQGSKVPRPAARSCSITSNIAIRLNAYASFYPLAVDLSGHTDSYKFLPLARSPHLIIGICSSSCTLSSSCLVIYFQVKYEWPYTTHMDLTVMSCAHIAPNRPLESWVSGDAGTWYDRLWKFRDSLWPGVA